MAELLIMGDNPEPVLIGYADIIGLDCETTGLTWNDRVLGLSLAWRQGEEWKSCYLIDPKGTQQLPMWGVGGTVQSADVMGAVERAEVVAMHNHSFDYRMLMHYYGLHPIPHVVDVQHVSKHLGPQPSTSLLTLRAKYLKDVSPAYAEMKGKRAGLDKVDPETVAAYAREDAVATVRLYNHFKSAANVTLYKKNHLHDQQFMWLVMAMVERGLPLDLEHIALRIRDYRRRMIELGQKLASLGVANPNYSKDVMGYAKSKGIDLPNTVADNLEQYAESYPVLAEVVEYRQLSKAIGSWLEDFHAYGLWDGNIHGQLNPYGTRSFRMSAEEPNLQGVPMEERGNRAFGSMFGVFKSHDPHLQLWALDIKQAELRLAATLGKDPDMLEAVSDVTVDPYVALAKMIWNDGSKDKRQMAKRAQLSAIYEVGVAKFARTNGISEDDADVILRAIRARFPTAMRTAKAMSKMTEVTGRVDMITGRPRWMQADEREQSYKAFNQYVQSALAEIMDETMLRVEQCLPGRLVLQVHDSLVLLLNDQPEARKQQVAMVQQCLNEAVASLLTPKYKPAAFPVDPKPWQVL